MSLKDCPDLETCEIPTTREIYKRICNGPGHVNCFHYCKRRDLLEAPMAWRQKMRGELLKRHVQDQSILRARVEGVKGRAD